MVSREVIFPAIQSTDLSDHKELGTGCFGRVMTCVYKPIGTVTVKFALSLRKTEQEELQKEFEYLIKIGTSHPNIVKAYGLIQDPFDGRGLVMEYISGGTLDALFQRKDLTYKVDHIVSWMAQISSAVAHMHTHGIIHRDLKPINMLLDPSYTHLKVCDFGFARVIDQSMSLRTGSWFWMAPEVMISGHYDQKCDVFSLGIVLWQLTAREKPYSELKKVSEIEYMQLVGKQGVRPRKLGCIPELEQLMEWCWESDADQRPSSSDVRDTCTEMCRVYSSGLHPPMELYDEAEQLHPPIGAFEGLRYLETTAPNSEDFLSKSRRRDNLVDLISSRRSQKRLDAPVDIPKLDRPMLTDLTLTALLTMSSKGEVLDKMSELDESSASKPSVDSSLPENLIEVDEVHQRLSNETNGLLEVSDGGMPHVHFGETTVLVGLTPLSSTLSLAPSSFAHSPIPEPLHQNSQTLVNMYYPGATGTNDYSTRHDSLLESWQIRVNENTTGNAGTHSRTDGVLKVNDETEIHFETTNLSNQTLTGTNDSQPLIRPLKLDSIRIGAGAVEEKEQQRPSPSSLDIETPPPRHKYVSLVTSPGTMIQISGIPNELPRSSTSPRVSTNTEIPMEAKQMIGTYGTQEKASSGEAEPYNTSSTVRTPTSPFTLPAKIETYSETKRTSGNYGTHARASPIKNEENRGSDSPVRTPGSLPPTSPAFSSKKLPIGTLNAYYGQHKEENSTQNVETSNSAASPTFKTYQQYRDMQRSSPSLLGSTSSTSSERNNNFESSQKSTEYANDHLFETYAKSRERKIPEPISLRDEDHDEPVYPESPAPPLPTPVTPNAPRIAQFTDYDLIQRVMNEQAPEEAPQEKQLIQVEQSADIDRMTEKDRKAYLSQFESPTTKPTKLILNRMKQFENQPIIPRPERLRLKEDENNVWIKSTKLPKAEYKTVGERATLFEKKGPILPSFR
ncbi:unnamed protein product, partial [Mesorhabditis belari]|uniref:Protein kinase domain-containing protein n=1 Tax=Mesorhabditis belari TaxID=2138241 RepID=A0AAF3J2D3_9BILA